MNLPNGIDADLSAAPPVQPLTARETEVLQLVARGRTNRQIASGLGITETTAKFHVGSLIRKFSATSRTELTFLAIKAGAV